jgi:hypothetical protein
VGLCYWNEVPLSVQIVHQCSRYQQRVRQHDK